jgi:hypothetical protein
MTTTTIKAKIFRSFGLLEVEYWKKTYLIQNELYIKLLSIQ